MIKNRIVKIFKTKKTLYDPSGNILCAGKTEVGGRLKVKTITYNSRVCNLLKLAHRPNRNNNLLNENDIYVGENTLGRYYKKLLKRKIPDIFEKYENKVAELWTKNEISFIKVKYTHVIILLPVELNNTIQKIVNNKELFRRQRWRNASNKMNKVTGPLKTAVRLGAAVSNP